MGNTKEPVRYLTNVAMTKLFIIGNGFDINHKLQTGYHDFHQFVSNHYVDLENFFEEYFELKLKNNLWSDFENDLGTFKCKLFFEDNNHLNINDDDFSPMSRNCLEDDLTQKTDELVRKIKEAFWNWLNQIGFEGVSKKYSFDDDSVFLTFNYTLTLEEVYKIPNEKVIHIHGDIENNQDSFVFGHNAELVVEFEIDENGDSNRTVFTDSENISKYPFYAFKKPVSEIIAENRIFFERLKSIEEVKVLGHSLSPIDISYFREIVKQTGNSIKWEVSFYREEEKESHLLSLQGIGIEKSNIKLFKMN